MKKSIISAVALFMVLAMAGCSCWSAKDDGCVIPTHKEESWTSPAALNYAKPAILPSKDAFRPVFTAGSKRLSVVADGKKADIALDNAVSKFCLEYNCDLIVAAKAVVVKTTHPRWFFFNYKTYRVFLSGMPVTITGLNKEVAPASYLAKFEKQDNNKDVNVVKAPVAAPAKAPAKASAEASAKAPAACAPAFLTLSDIKINMTATAATDSKVAVKVPACKK